MDTCDNCGDEIPRELQPRGFALELHFGSHLVRTWLCAGCVGRLALSLPVVPHLLAMLAHHVPKELLGRIPDIETQRMPEGSRFATRGST